MLPVSYWSSIQFGQKDLVLSIWTCLSTSSDLRILSLLKTWPRASNLLVSNGTEKLMLACSVLSAVSTRPLLRSTNPHPHQVFTSLSSYCCCSIVAKSLVKLLWWMCSYVLPSHEIPVDTVNIREDNLKLVIRSVLPHTLHPLLPVHHHCLVHCSALVIIQS